MKHHLTVGELRDAIKDLPPTMRVNLYTNLSYTAACSCEVMTDYDDDKPWKDDGTSNQVPTFFIGDEEAES